MKKPKLPNNPNYWFAIIKDEEKVKAFLERGTSLQKCNLERALQYAKWKKIQEEKEDI